MVIKADLELLQANLMAVMYGIFIGANTAMQMHIDNAHVGNLRHSSSDYRIKQNIATQTESGIDKVKQLRPVTYQYTDYKVFKADGVTREGLLHMKCKKLFQVLRMVQKMVIQYNHLITMQ